MGMGLIFTCLPVSVSLQFIPCFHLHIHPCVELSPRPLPGHMREKRYESSRVSASYECFLESKLDDHYNGSPAPSVPIPSAEPWRHW